MTVYGNITIDNVGKIHPSQAEMGEMNLKAIRDYYHVKERR